MTEGAWFCTRCNMQ